MELEPTSYTINKVVPFKDSVQDYLKSRIGAEGNEKYVTDQLALLNGGVLTDIRYSWLSNGSKFEVIHTKTGSKVAAWNFGALLHDFDTTVACVTDLPSIHGKPPIAVVGLDCELTGGMICFFDINSSRVIRAIQIDDKVSSIHVVNAGNDLSLPGALRALDGVLAIGTHRGKVLLMDICRQICDEAILNTGDRVKDEINSCHLTFLSLCDLEHLEYHKELSLKNEDHICIQLNPHSTSSEHFALHGPDKEVRLHANMVEVAISALFYCPQLGSLLVGYNFGAYQLYNLSNMKLIYTSPVYEDCIPITHFAVQEPCDDPRAYCYVWVVYNTIEKGDKTFPMAVMYAFAYNNKDYLEGYGHLYQEFVSCSVRFQMELRLTGLKSAIGAKCLCLQSYSKALAPRQGAAPFVDAPEEKLALCNIVWSSWNSQNAAMLETYFCMFDLNQWYKEQMPGSTQLTDTNCNSYISCVSLSTLLSPVSQLSCSNDLLDVRISPNTFSQFVCAQRLEEHYFPSALAFQGVIFRGNDCVWFANSGIQRHLLMQLEVVGSLGLIRPTELFQRCLDFGLTPIYTDVPYGNSASTSLKIQREFILSVALEQQLVRWLCQCGRDWANGSQSGAGCTLDLLLNWAWQRANVLKFQSDKLCIPLFDHTGSRLDANAVIQLNHCACQLKNLTILFEHVADNFTMYYSEQDIADIRYQAQSLQMISMHLEVLHWLLNVGLLPECPLSMYPLSDETVRVSAPYPAEKLSTFYQCKRKELYHLQNPDEEEFCPQNAITTSCDLLFIDNLIDLECSGEILKKQWESDCGNGLYPPPSLQALLRSYFIENIDIVHKHCLFIYLFLDLAMTLDESRYKSIIPHLIKFPAVFKINPSIIKITQAFWQLDHGDFSTAMTQLLDPSVNNEDLKPWHHRTLLKALLIQGQHQHALLYQQVRKPPVSSIQDICITTTLLIVNDLVQEAFHFQRQHRSIFNQKEILLHFFQTCDKMNQLPVILHLSLSSNEEQEFLSYLNNSPDTKVKTLLVVFYLQRAQYGDAFRANDLLNNYEVMKQGLLGQQDREFRNVVIAGFRKTLPNVTQKLLDFCKSNNPKFTPSVISVKRPNPMSVYVHDATEQAKYKSTFIQASMLKVRETWKQRSLNEIPFIFTSKPVTSLASSRMNSSLIYPSIIEVSSKNTTVEHDITEDVTPAKRRRLSSRSSINNASHSHTLDTSVSRRTLSCYNSESLLSTPIVKRRSYRSSSVASNILDSFVVDTPGSILKVRSFIRNSQSPETGGNSTTPEILEEDQNSETEMIVQTTARKTINLETSAIKRRSSLRITPRKSISRTPRFGVHFEDERRPNSQSSNESGENSEVQKMDVCIKVHRERTLDEPIADDPSVQIDSKNSSRSTDDVFYSPKQSLSFSDQKTTDVSAISSSLCEPKELSKISEISSLESNSFVEKNDKRSSLKRKANDSVRSRRSYRNNSTSTILQETISPIATELKTPEVVPKLASRKSLTRQVLENNLKMKVLSTPSFKQLFSPKTEKDVTISKNTTEVINIHTSGDVTEEIHSVTTTETKDEFVTTKNEQESQKIHSFNESYSKFITKSSEIIELEKNVVPTLERSHVLSFSSDVSDVPDISYTTSEDEQIDKKIEDEVEEQNEIEEKISDQSNDEEEQINVDLIEEQTESGKEEIEIEEESENEDELISNSDKESEEEIVVMEEQGLNSDAEEEEEELLESMASEEEDSEAKSSNKFSKNEEEKESYSSGNSSDVIEIKSTSEESSEESHEELDNKLVDIDESSSEEDEIDEEHVEEGKEAGISEMQNVYSDIYDDLDEIEDDTNVLERNITSSTASTEDVNKNKEETEYLQYASEEITDAQENRSLMNQDYEENMQAIEEVTEKENADDFVVESVVLDKEELVKDVENRCPKNQKYDENIQVVEEFTEKENVKNMVVESVVEDKEELVEVSQENIFPINQDYEENMEVVEKIREKENADDFVIESVVLDKEELAEDVENRCPKNQNYDENIKVVEQFTEKENVKNLVVESIAEDKKELIEVSQENIFPINQDYEENMEVVEEVREKENAGDVDKEEIKIVQDAAESRSLIDQESMQVIEEITRKKNVKEDKDELVEDTQENIQNLKEVTEKENVADVEDVKEDPKKEAMFLEEKVDEKNKQDQEELKMVEKSRVLRRLRSNSTTDVGPQDLISGGRSLRRTRSQSVEITTDNTKAVQIPRRINVEHKEPTVAVQIPRRIRVEHKEPTVESSVGGISLRRTRSVEATENLKVSQRLKSNSITEVEHKEPTSEGRSLRRTRSQSVEINNTKARGVRACSVKLDDILEEEAAPKKKRKARRTSTNSSATNSSSSAEGTPARPRRQSFTLAQQAIHSTTGTKKRSSSRASSAHDVDDNFSDTASVASDASVPVTLTATQPSAGRSLRHRSLSPNMLKKELVASLQTPRRSTRGLILLPKSDLSNITEEKSTGSAMEEEKAETVATKRGALRDTAGPSHHSQSTTRRRTYKPLESYLPQHAVVKTRKSYKFRKLPKRDPAQ